MSQGVKLRTPSASKSSKRAVSCDASTKDKSKMFMKQMLALPISHIVFLRGILGNEEFSTRFIGDLEIKMIKDSKKKDNSARLLIEWMTGVFDALDKDYLKSATLTIHDPSDPRDNPIESYTFSVSYKDGNTTSLSLQRNGETLNDARFSENNLKLAAINLLTNLCDNVEALETLPDEVVLNMELSYYDDVTPHDYEPPGFQSSEPKLRTDAEEVGDLETKHHRLSVKVYTRQFAELSSCVSPRTAGRSALICEDSSIGVVSPRVRPIPMDTEDAPAVPAGPEAPILADAPPAALPSASDVNSEAPAKGGKRGKGKKGGKRKAPEDSPSAKNSDAIGPKSVKRAKK